MIIVKVVFIQPMQRGKARSHNAIHEKATATSIKRDTFRVIENQIDLL
jgi:hypothetical protein